MLLPTNRVYKMDEVFQRFLLTFYTIVYGIIVSQFFSGWENLIRFRDKIRLYNIHLLWTILAFLFVIQTWWGLWRYKEYFSQNFICFFLILLWPGYQLQWPASDGACGFPVKLLWQVVEHENDR